MLWARSPKVFIGVALLYGALNRKRSPISPALRSLVTVRVSQINHCEFCVDINAATLIKRGVSEEKVLKLSNWRNDVGFEPVERLALELCEAMNRPGFTGGSKDRINWSYGKEQEIKQIFT
ncbi:MAG: carboxymuconolactone decarboxylase family protein [Devosiaceae bacterium]|nr:carboxymuconolactone decarboxylase family protein [Devosiaceae bacterium]